MPCPPPPSPRLKDLLGSLLPSPLSCSFISWSRVTRSYLEGFYRPLWLFFFKCTYKLTDFISLKCTVLWLFWSKASYGTSHLSWQPCPGGQKGVTRELILLSLAKMSQKCQRNVVALWALVVLLPFFDLKNIYEYAPYFEVARQAEIFGALAGQKRGEKILFWGSKLSLFFFSATAGYKLRNGWKACCRDEFPIFFAQKISWGKVMERRRGESPAPRQTRRRRIAAIQSRPSWDEIEKHLSLA